MNFADLTDTDFKFNCEFSGDGCDYWDYDFSITYGDEKYSRDMSSSEIEQLRENCKRILQVTSEFQGGY